MQDVLLLNADYRPVKVVSWERAVCLLLSRKARTVTAYNDRYIRSATLELAWPAVVSLVEYARVRVSPTLSRRNLFARDGFACVYCGFAPLNQERRPDTTRLTVDHVVPRSRAVRGVVVVPWTGERVSVSGWENLVAACGPCNHDRADRTPEEAGLTLRVRPRRPNGVDILRIALSRASVPAEWKDYL